MNRQSARLALRLSIPLLVLWVSTSATGAAEKRPTPLFYSGLCDASAAVTVSSNLFLVASDEDNILRLYRLGSDGSPIRRFDVNRFLDLEHKSPEGDIEGAAMVGKRAFWIGSHGRNRMGRVVHNRSRLFATDVRPEGDAAVVTPVGRPCKVLLEALLGDARFSRFGLARAADLAPKEEGALNIEGLAATPEGHLLIGFRNPIPNEKALLIPIHNPNDILNGAWPAFGEAIQLDLAGLGVRDIVLHEGRYAILAGPFHSGGPFAFYQWNGGSATAELIDSGSFRHFHPEALVFFPGREAPLVLSDDGTVLKNGVPCKDLKRESQRSFRAFWLPSR